MTTTRRIEREIVVIRARLSGKTLRQAGAEIGVSGDQARNYEATGLRRLRQRATDLEVVFPGLAQKLIDREKEFGSGSWRWSDLHIGPL